MKNLRKIVSAVAVFAVVGSALAFKSTKDAANLFICNAQNFCVPTNASDVGGSPALNPNIHYKINNGFPFACPRQTNPSIGCAINPNQAFRND